MSLPNFPIPNLDTTLQEAGRVLGLILPLEEFQRYQSALRRQEAELQEIHVRFTARATGRENWGTEEFKSRLLSCPNPIPTSTALPVLLQPSAVQGTPQLEGGPQLARAAALLWAAAKIHSDPRLLEGDAALEQTQRSELFSACREPGETRDQIKIYPDSLHAALLYQGSAFPLQLLSQAGDPLPLPQIHSQLLGAVRTPPGASLPLPASPCSLTALERPVWHALREDLLSRGAGGSLRTLESAVLALALEDCPSPDPRDPTAALTSIRLGSPETRGMRHYDKVLNLVVFSDGSAGLLFEHSAVDGMVAGLLAQAVWSLSEEELRKQPAPPETTAPLPLVQPLEFSLEAPPSPRAAPPSTRTSCFEYRPASDVLPVLRGSRGLLDAWITFSLQLGLKRAFSEEEEGSGAFLMVTPTHVRHFKHGRCNPTYSLSRGSLDLLGALLSKEEEEEEEGETRLLSLFSRALAEHKSLIKATKKGRGVGPHLAALRCSLGEGSELKGFLDRFGRPSVYLTGQDLVGGVDSAVGNVYAQDQLAVTYLGKEDKVCLAMSGKGSFARKLGGIQGGFRDAMDVVAKLALKYALASQRGALESSPQV
ncbi:carnitine O-acetyltransferase-like [Acipenser ruthenus]|uniref:carnitine O-acetyltransferase-like n=1 Tax=Acipenser ruthenus TaxID=7906 RepID=UPI0027417C40|nr:carnitine O-acetyltransferase-like [Acipenser ruthenus]XP_058877290.1 carnitine O-acetyltransferase-like [Acipenser ruthenus]XP_058877291.1 carnitine O-acetyltransferase-like [Acipenser ruthenus]